MKNENNLYHISLFPSFNYSKDNILNNSSSENHKNFIKKIDSKKGGDIPENIFIIQ